MSNLVMKEEASTASAHPSSLSRRDKTVPDYTVELPSRGVFYSGKSSIQVKPFTVKQVKQLYAASRAQTEYERESIVAETLADSVVDFDIYDLTVGDYNFLLYWVRLNSYKKSPFVVEWEYTNLSGDKKKVISTVVMTDFEVLECDPAKKPVNHDFRYTTLRDKIQMLQLVDPGDLYVAAYASVFPGKSDNKIVSLIDKIKKLESMHVDIISDIKRHLERFKHGIIEYVYLRDEEVADSEKIKVKLELKLVDFFP